VGTECFGGFGVGIRVSTGAWVLVVTVVAALAFGLYRALTDGRFRGTHQVHGADQPVLDTSPGPESLLAALLQFSSAFCAPCRATRRILGEVATSTPGVAHIEVDAEHHLDVVRRLGILRTPTTIVLDAAGAEVTRASGLPTKQQVLSALAAV
jgi:thiol-disulfide isomerase/thioredoxin